jgi:hypothetical protein
LQKLQGLTDCAVVEWATALIYYAELERTLACRLLIRNVMKKRQADSKLRVLTKIIRDLKPAEIRRAAGGDTCAPCSNNRPCPGLSMQCGQTYSE